MQKANKKIITCSFKNLKSYLSLQKASKLTNKRVITGKLKLKKLKTFFQGPIQLRATSVDETLELQA